MNFATIEISGIMEDLNIDYKGYLFRFALAVLSMVAVYSAVDFWTLRIWDTSESLVVEVVDIGDAKILSPEDDEPFRTVETELAIQVLTGEQKEETFSIVVTQMEDNGTELKKGRRYILIVDVFDDGSMQYSIADVFRIPSVIGVVVFACGCLIAFTGRVGARALLGLGVSVACLLWGYIPLVVKGAPPVPLAFLAVFFISAATVFCVVHRKQARAVVLLGSLGGVSGAFLLGALMIEIWQVSGLAGESASLLVTTIAGINIKGILLSSVIISAIGAVLDVGISITAAMSELVEYDSEIERLRLWAAGIRVGSEVLGSMINTLILAYIGTSLPIAILIANAGVNFWGLMNDPYVSQEIVQSLAGTSGLLLTIPITATFFVLFNARKAGRGFDALTPPENE
ncbi:MAG: YibE/F family protein [Synergistaceae bacterium]|nr:YibE/F family protein [Synergistaceae bacterium]